eukprot:4775949-Pyramimonas_sp.AAC.1
MWLDSSIPVFVKALSAEHFRLSLWPSGALVPRGLAVARDIALCARCFAEQCRPRRSMHLSHDADDAL